MIKIKWTSKRKDLIDNYIIKFGYSKKEFLNLITLIVTHELHDDKFVFDLIKEHQEYWVQTH